MTENEQFFWVALRSHPEAFEPARVDFDGETPDLVWFTAMDTAFDASDCIIAERIVRDNK